MIKSSSITVNDRRIFFTESITKSYVFSSINNAIEYLNIDNLILRDFGDLTEKTPYKLKPWGLFKMFCKKPNEYYHLFGRVSYESDKNLLSLAVLNNFNHESFLYIFDHLINTYAIFKDMEIHVVHGNPNYGDYIIRYDNLGD